MNHIEKIQSIIADLQNHRVEAVDELNGLRLTLTGDAASDQSIHTEIATGEAEVASFDKQIGNYQAGLDQAAKRDSAEGVAARKKELRAVGKKVVAKAANRAAIDEQIDTAYRTIGDLLARRQEANVQMLDLYREFSGLRSTKDTPSSEYPIIDRIVGNDTGSVSALEWAAWAAGVGRVGVLAGLHVQRPFYMQEGLADVGNATVDRLRAKVDAALQAEGAA
jgi:hypothetical protein